MPASQSRCGRSAPVAMLLGATLAITGCPLSAGDQAEAITSTAAPRVAGTAPGPRQGAAASVRVLGNRLVDAGGAELQLRGVNYSGFEFVAIQGWNPADPSGAQAGQAQGPNWAALKSWKVNTVRLPLNEASWLGRSCIDTSGVRHDPDPGDNYQAAVTKQVEQALAQGLYVIVDLHWSAPGDTCPMLQTQMANRDHSLAFWHSVATHFKHQPAVMFELFNEPFLNFGYDGGDPWAYLMHGRGGRFTAFPATSGSGNWQTVERGWDIASYQSMLDTVRATGARNVVLIGGLQYAQDLSGWLAQRPLDPLQQIAAVWHAYPRHGADWGSADYAQPNGAPAIYRHLRAIQAAGIPVVATETGDRNAPGTVGAPLVSTITAWADANGVGVVGWGWGVWQEPDNVLIRDRHGAPTDGYGQVYRDWLLAH